MRSYPRNSPQAAGRIVALVLIADGHVCRSEFEALNGQDAAGQLGLAADELPRLVQQLCEDLLMSDPGSSTPLCRVEEATLAALMAELTDPVLQQRVLQLASAAARADAHLAEGEALVLEAARRHWGLSEAHALQPCAAAIS
jgi:hypothetical protein